jgi:uncharacterized pyridoxal phosphate-containing UPF0001 family protein
VNISNEASKGGVPVHEALALAQAVATLTGSADAPGLRLRGLMAIPAPGADAAVYAQMTELMNELRAAGLAVDTLSMGMSDDLELAIAHGATYVRDGTALFGQRPMVTHE